MVSPLALGGEGSGEDALKGIELHLGDVGKGDAIEGTAGREAKLQPEVTEVAAGRLGARADQSAITEAGRVDVPDGLLPDDGNVPLCNPSVSRSLANLRHGRGAAYLENVQRNARFWGQGVGVAPGVGEARLVEATLLDLIQVGSEGDVILHRHGKARTQHGRSDETSQELHSQSFIALIADSHLQHDDEVQGRLVHRIALLDRDELGHVPRDLLDGADHALKGALQAVTREWRLEQ